MLPSDPLTILELRLKDPDLAAALSEGLLRGSLSAALGPEAAAALIGLHVEEGFAFLFFDKAVGHEAWLAGNPGFELNQVHQLRYDQWQDGAGSAPIRLGPLDIAPIGAAGEPRAARPVPGPAGGRRRLIIDPGLAFGFGGHPTTLACLEFLVRVYHPGLTSPEPVPRSALDLGCGTGVLALAAASLGAERVIGVDSSHLAVEAAKKNVLANHLSGQVEIVRGLAQEAARQEAELVMANIPLFVLRDLVEAGAFGNRRRLIVSGLLTEEGETFLGLLSRRLPFRIIDSKRSDRWVSYLLGPAG
jgi:ribosomal protein L11 methyltransferase